ncbi:hypothetical protein [Arthrobacter sp. SLBN-100]|uniref:hypothetical protein n=1 Tax=Arthrobacter sp. SLBN-100 TaxID=2768450 RepID=UPI001F1C91D4|nr:hypothetical protein [Arthrobacter sp. SLBN-100]
MAQASGIADTIVSVVPVVNQVVPGDTITAVAAPIAYVADGATAAVVEAVVPPVAESLPVLEPVLQPVSDVVTGRAPLPVELPELPLAAVDEEVPAAAAAVPTGASAAVESALANIPEPSESFFAAAPDTATFPDGAAALAGTSAALWAATSASGLGNEQPSTADPSPAHAPAVPGSGTGSGAASGGSPGSAAFLSSFSFDLPLSGAVCAGESPEHAPAPVSFDPGSSPD